MHQMQTEKLKRTQTNKNKKALNRKQKLNRIDSLSKNGKVIPDEIQSETLSNNKISKFLQKILGIEEKARQKVTTKSEKEETALPNGDLKTTKVQKPVKRKVKKSKKKKSQSNKKKSKPKKKKSKPKKKGQKKLKKENKLRRKKKF